MKYSRILYERNLSVNPSHTEYANILIVFIFSDLDFTVDHRIIYVVECRCSHFSKEIHQYKFCVRHNARAAEHTANDVMLGRRIFLMLFAVINHL